MIFIWIPKTGGTTFSEVVPMKVVTENYSEHIIDDWTANITYGHACPKKLLTCGIIRSDVWKYARKVSIVRDPYTRFVSLYHDYKRTGRIPPDFSQLDFIRAIIEMDPKPDLYNSYRLSMCSPQVEWLIPGVEILRYEDYLPTVDTIRNKGMYNDTISEDARGPVRHFYKADFAALNYDE